MPRRRWYTESAAFTPRTAPRSWGTHHEFQREERTAMTAHIRTRTTVLRATVTLVVGLALALAGLSVGAQQPKQLVLASSIPPGIGTGKAVQFFAKRVEELTKGATIVKTHM